MLPIVGCLYGCVVNALSNRISLRRPYGWLSTRSRRSSFTTSTSFSNASRSTRSVAMRSASSQSASGRYCDGSVSQNTVASSCVYALLRPPMLAMIEVCDSGSTFFEPLNIMCSNRCAKPVRPGFSFLEPTWYQTDRCTIGVE